MPKLNAYQLKWIAIIGMVLSHMVAAWWEIIPNWLAFPMWAAGGLTFPIMAFFAVEGYRHTSNLKRYILRLFIVGLIAAPFHILALGMTLGGGNPSLYPWVNIMFSIILGLLTLVLYDKIKSRVAFWLIYVIIIVPFSFIFFEWYFIGITMILLHYIIKNETVRRVVSGLFAAVMFMILAISMSFMQTIEGYTRISGALLTYPEFIPVMFVFPIGIIVSALLVKNYNGERGKKMKWLFYIVYPLHFIVLIGVALALGLMDLSIFSL
ncbi:MAG: conjugal transfer protein TraX [Defluviitaleaceae bacterium]|nr:conjugal transfer protein TraX [Defluviitaleaceae bacterium]